MSDQFQTVQSSGLLKNNYEDNPDQLEDILRKRRQKLADKKLNLDPDLSWDSDEEGI